MEALWTFDVLRDLVAEVRCKPGWSFRIDPGIGAECLVIAVTGPDAAAPDDEITVRHFFPVPFASYNRNTWRRWLFERCRGVENHELGEWFRDGNERPFAPTHGPGEDPYVVHEYREDVDRRTAQDGSVRPS
jgi:hypothetical protein